MVGAVFRSFRWTGKRFGIEISGQEMIIQRLAPGQTGEMDAIANRADGTSSLTHTLRVSRDQYGALKTVQITLGDAALIFEGTDIGHGGGLRE